MQEGTERTEHAASLARTAAWSWRRIVPLATAARAVERCSADPGPMQHTPFMPAPERASREDWQPALRVRRVSPGFPPPRERTGFGYAFPFPRAIGSGSCWFLPSRPCLFAPRRRGGGGRPANAVRLLRETEGARRAPAAAIFSRLPASSAPRIGAGLQALRAAGRSADGPAGNAPMGKGRKPLPSGGTAPLPP